MSALRKEVDDLIVHVDRLIAERDRLWRACAYVAMEAGGLSSAQMVCLAAMRHQSEEELLRQQGAANERADAH